MTWSKFGEEFGDAARGLSDAAFRTHVEAIMWSNRRLLDLVITPTDVRRFAETLHPEKAVDELVDTGWWQKTPEGWFIGCRFAEWQLESSVIEVRRAQATQRQRRHRMHAAGDHSLCGERCTVTRDKTRDEMRDPERNGSERHGSGSALPPTPENDEDLPEEDMWAEVRETWPDDAA